MSCNESGKYAIFLSDRYGFNNPDSEWDLSKTKWVLTGDSFTQGACVNPGEEIPGQIRSITGESVINLGNAGNGPLIELAVLKEYAESIKPKIVLWMYYENDLGNLKKEKSVPLLMRYLEPEFSQNLIHRQTDIDDRLEGYIAEKEVTAEKEATSEKIKYFESTEVLRLYNIRQALGLDFSGAYPLTLFSEILTKARDRVAAWGGKLYFVYLPEFSRYQLHMKYRGLDKRESNVVNAVKNLNIPIIHIQEVFANHPDPLSLFPFQSSAHYNAEGYSEVAKAVVLYFTGERKSRKTIDEGD